MAIVQITVGIMITFGVFMIFTAIFQWLWNITIPKVFDNARQIGFWAAFRLLLIAGFPFFMLLISGLLSSALTVGFSQ
ncbi:MAG: hypothetical protein QM612_09710 [Thermomonas sp.]|uniref:hypothetical protein n=1 Tax=Thermomonas sp. TaxID=1971895 RepID=UPI0039E2D62C